VPHSEHIENIPFGRNHVQAGELRQTPQSIYIPMAINT